MDGIITEAEKVKLLEEHFCTKDLQGSKYMRDFNKIFDEISEIEPGEIKKMRLTLEIFSLIQ